MILSKTKIISIFLFIAICVCGISVYTIFSSASEGGELFVSSTSDGQDYPWYEYFFDTYDVRVIQNSNAEMTYPDRFVPNMEQNITDLSYWIDILPFAEDKNRNGYVVYPRHGMIVPLDQTSSHDDNLIQNGKAFDHYPYLEDGALHYRGKGPTEWNGNMVIAAHSSYEKQEPGRYKTVFQGLPISQPGDHIFVYQKNTQWTYDMYDYVIYSSFETDKYDTSVLAQSTNKKTLTTYWCYEIWVNDKRWINQANLHREIKNISLQEKNNPPAQIPKVSQKLVPNNTQKDPVEKTQEAIIVKEYKQEINQPTLKTIDTSIPKNTQIPEVFVHQLSNEMKAKADTLIHEIKKRIWNNSELNIKVEYRLARKLLELKDEDTQTELLKKEILKYIQFKLYPNYSK